MWASASIFCFCNMVNFISGGLKGATEANIEEYMLKLQTLATEGKSTAIVKQARDILNRVELPI